MITVLCTNISAWQALGRGKTEKASWSRGRLSGTSKDELPGEDGKKHVPGRGESSAKPEECRRCGASEFWEWSEQKGLVV